MHWHKDRRQYDGHRFSRRLEDTNKLPKSPIQLFDEWFKTAVHEGLVDPEAMTLSTVEETPEGNQPVSRIVLVKAYGEAGFLFFTNKESRKGVHLLSNDRVALNVYWAALERQVVVLGRAATTPDDVSDRYFEGRPFLSKVAAHVSKQSQPLRSRRGLERRFEASAKAFGKEAKGFVPRPRAWGGYQVKPHAIEFWQGRTNRLHDRILYSRGPKTNHWTLRRLAP